MLTYILRRLVLLVPVLLGVTLLTFAMTRILPGDPINQIVSPLADKAQRQQLIHQHGLDRPVLVQYWSYVKDLAHGDLGDSFSTSEPVLTDLTSRFGATFELTLYAILLAIATAVPLGIAAAVRRDRTVDHLVRIVSVTGVALPVFWLSLMALYIFFFKLHVLPALYGRIDPSVDPPRQITGLLTVDSLLTGDWTALRSSSEALVLPVVVLAFSVMAPLARITRSGMIDALESDYVRAARSLGLSSRVVIRHAFRNALLPLVTMVAVVYGYLLGGVVLVENIFAWPGLGRYVFNAITSSDYPAVQGFILYATTIYVLLFLIVDVTYLFVDPRVRRGSSR